MTLCGQSRTKSCSQHVSMCHQDVHTNCERIVQNTRTAKQKTILVKHLQIAHAQKTIWRPRFHVMYHSTRFQHARSHVKKKRTFIKILATELSCHVSPTWSQHARTRHRQLQYNFFGSATHKAGYSRLSVTFKSPASVVKSCPRRARRDWTSGSWFTVTKKCVKFFQTSVK